MNEEEKQKIKIILSKDFTKITDAEAEELFSEDTQSTIYNLAKVCRGLTRIFMLEPCTWGTDFTNWTLDDKKYSKELLKFLLKTNGFQNIKT